MKHNMTRSALARHLGVGRVTLWRWQRDGIIPAPARVSPTCSIFDAAAIMAAESAARAMQGGAA